MNMVINRDFQMKQARYELMQTLEILFNKKDTGRISAKISFEDLRSQVKGFINIILHNREHVVSSICKADTLDDYTLGHSLNVCMLSVLIGEQTHYGDHELLDLAISALLHDIGKRFTPKELIFKTGKLTDEEFDVMKRHPLDGADFISSIYPETPERILRGIREHHERMNGKGYPKALSWYDISKFGRIIAVADVYEAFTALRSYHDKRTIQEGIDCIRTAKGLDRNIVELFINNTVFYPAGIYLVFSDQTIAVVHTDRFGYIPDVVIPGTNDCVDIRQKKIVSVL